MSTSPDDAGKRDGSSVALAAALDRVGPRSRRVNVRTVLPLTRPGGIQAWKIVIPGAQSTPDPRAHDGFEWRYVLSGQMRLLLGDQGVVLGVGEAAEFDTQVPHSFGSTGCSSAEVLSIFGRPGERMHLHDQSDADASGGRH